MRRIRRKMGTAGTLAILGLFVALAVPMANLVAADHLDSPVFSSRLEVDINDVYAFNGASLGSTRSTVLAATVSPGALVADFGDKDNARYVLRVDMTGDAVPDLAYAVEFTTQGNNDEQRVRVRMAKGEEAASLTPGGKLLANGHTNEVMTLKGGGLFFAGRRSDPFFFDLDGFRGTVDGIPPLRFDGSTPPIDMLGNSPTDFFENLNTLAIVIEVPDTALGGGPISVWATTSALDSSGNWIQNDRMGRPAINTVVNSTGPIVMAPSGQKVAYNASITANDVQFTDAVVNALLAFSSLDAEGDYSQGQAEALAGLLLPDVLPFDKLSTLPAPLEGRALADDVIDVELRVVTGGDPLDLFPDRDANGAINSDGVGPHDDYLSTFPYLGVPH